MGVSFRKGLTSWGLDLPKKGSHGRVSESRQRRGWGRGGWPKGVSAPQGASPGCSWLLTGASNLAAAGDLNAWHSRAAGLLGSSLAPAAPSLFGPAPLACCSFGSSEHKGRLGLAGGGVGGFAFSWGNPHPPAPSTAHPAFLPTPHPAISKLLSHSPRSSSPTQAGSWFYLGS